MALPMGKVLLGPRRRSRQFGLSALDLAALPNKVLLEPRLTRPEATSRCHRQVNADMSTSLIAVQERRLPFGAIYSILFAIVGGAEVPQ